MCISTVIKQLASFFSLEMGICVLLQRMSDKSGKGQQQQQWSTSQSLVMQDSGFVSRSQSVSVSSTKSSRQSSSRSELASNTSAYDKG